MKRKVRRIGPIQRREIRLAFLLLFPTLLIELGVLYGRLKRVNGNVAAVLFLRLNEMNFLLKDRRKESYLVNQWSSGVVGYR